MELPNAFPIARDAVRAAITQNAMAGADPDVPYHLAVDASDDAIGGCLFQLHGAPAGTEASPKFLLNERIIMFLSFRLVKCMDGENGGNRELTGQQRHLWYPKVFASKGLHQDYVMKGKAAKILDENTNSWHYKMTRTNKAGVGIKEPRPPTSDPLHLFTTKAYDKYERSKHENNRLPQAAAGDMIMKDFRGYPLRINEFTTPEDIPTKARIDDYTIARLIDAQKSCTWY
ncbi:MAG: hypothetical protein Q9161_009340 [Pseudevernia consocians]